MVAANGFAAHLSLWALYLVIHLPLLAEAQTTAVYLGCYSDTATHQLSHVISTNDPALTVEKCVNDCRAMGFAYSGTQHGKECYCGWMLGQRHPESDCNSACTGDSSQTCGGAYKNSVFYIAGYKGCYVDSSINRKLPYLAYNSNSLTGKLCTGMCRGLGYTYAGIQYGKQCYCGSSSPGTLAPAANQCDKTCSGNSHEVCGGTLRNTVYDLTGYVGCFKDHLSRQMPREIVDASLTVDTCRSTCKTLGYDYAALSNRTKCFCGDDPGDKAAESECNLPCGGNAGQTCGAPYRSSVYHLYAPIETYSPTNNPTSLSPTTGHPSSRPTDAPTLTPTSHPTTLNPTTGTPTQSPSDSPSASPESAAPSCTPTTNPTIKHTSSSSSTFCTCSTPNAGTAGFNQFSCSDGSSATCAANEQCYSITAFPKSSASTLGCAPSGTQIHTVKCNATAKDTLLAVYLHGIKIPQSAVGVVEFKTRTGPRYTIGIEAKSVNPGPSCANAGIALACMSETDQNWDGFETNMKDWLAFSSMADAPPKTTWGDEGGDLSDFSLPCESTANFPVPIKDAKYLRVHSVPKKLWASSGKQYAWLVASRPHRTFSPTVTGAPSSTPTTETPTYTGRPSASPTSWAPTLCPATATPTHTGTPTAGPFILAGGATLTEDISKVATYPGSPVSPGGEIVGMDIDATPGAPKTLYYCVANGEHRISKMDVSTEVYTTLAGAATSGKIDGAMTTARFKDPHGVDVVYHNAGAPILYVADMENHRIRKIDINADSVTSVAGNLLGGSSGRVDGSLNLAKFKKPTDVAARAKANGDTVLYIADSGNNVLRKIVLPLGEVSTLAGTGNTISTQTLDGPANFVEFKTPAQVQLDLSFGAEMLYVTDKGFHAVRAVDLQTMLVTTVAGKVGTAGQVDGKTAEARFNNPTGLVIKPNHPSSTLYITEATRVRVVDLGVKAVFPVAGGGSYNNGPGGVVKFTSLESIAWSPDPFTVVVADQGVFKKIFLTATFSPTSLPTYTGESWSTFKAELFHKYSGDFTQCIWHPEENTYRGKGRCARYLEDRQLM